MKVRVHIRSKLAWSLVGAVLVSAAFLLGLVLPGALGIRIDVLAGPEGVAKFDKSRAGDGYLTVGVNFDNRVDLIARDGRVVHSWHLPYNLLGMATMDSDGSLLYLGQLPKFADKANRPAPMATYGVFQRLSWDGTVLWTLKDPLIHHDFTELPDGMIATLRLTRLDPTFAARIPGGTPGTEATGSVWTDQIIEIDPKSNKEHVVFDFANAWNPEEHPIPDYMSRQEWTHSNSIFYTPSDPVTHQEAYLISSRTVSTITLVARQTGRVIWSYGGDWVLDQQHDATLLPNGHVLLFDDGQYLRGAMSASRALEIDPLTNKVVWSYQGWGLAGSDFYSPITGGAQRLPNGDTLITLGTKGEIVEVTPDGQIVWDYSVPWGPPDPKYPGHVLNFLFKSRSYPASEVEPLLH